MSVLRDGSRFHVCVVEDEGLHRYLVRSPVTVLREDIEDLAWTSFPSDTIVEDPSVVRRVVQWFWDFGEPCPDADWYREDVIDEGSRASFSIDLDAPIVPGAAAAGIRLGSHTAPMLRAVPPEFTEPRENNAVAVHHWHSGAVRVFDRAGIVDQVLVAAGYRGLLMDCLSVGSTLEEIERAGYRWFEDDEDNLCLRGVDGLTFDVRPEDADRLEDGTACVAWWCVDRHRR